METPVAVTTTQNSIASRKRLSSSKRSTRRVHCDELCQNECNISDSILLPVTLSLSLNMDADIAVVSKWISGAISMVLSSPLQSTRRCIDSQASARMNPQKRSTRPTRRSSVALLAWIVLFSYIKTSRGLSILGMTLKKRPFSNHQNHVNEQLVPPRHVAIICDGNSRWAKGRGLPSYLGHAAGAEQLVNVLDQLKKTEGVQYCTIYAFSTENWKRPQSEIVNLLRIMEECCHRFYPRMMRERIRVKVLGDLDDERIPDGLRQAFEKIVRDTAANTNTDTSKNLIQERQRQEQDNESSLVDTTNKESFTVCFALNYGGRKNILDASVRLAEMIASGSINSDDANEELMSRLLGTSDIPDPDLIIRTSGECRLSNFMLWNAAYAELYFTNVLWPDFDHNCLKEALQWYSRRQRNFGGRHQAVTATTNETSVSSTTATERAAEYGVVSQSLLRQN